MTHQTLAQIQRDPSAVAPTTLSTVRDLAREYRFFHWHLEFPQIFSQRPRTYGDATEHRARDGFSLTLGNPPWDTLSPDRKEFFARWNPQVRSVGKEDQISLMSALLGESSIREAWRENQRTLLTLVHFLKESGRYRLYAPGNLGKGDFNIYRPFVEHALSTSEVSAQVVPTGLLSGANATAIRRSMLEDHRLVAVLSFQNEGGAFFPGVHNQFRFCSYVAETYSGPTTSFDMYGAIDSIPAVEGRKRNALRIEVDDVRREQPETLALPEGTDQQTRSLASAIAARVHAFRGPETRWPDLSPQRELDMSENRDDFSPPGSGGWPVMEGRMVDQFDYRAKTWLSGHGRTATWLPRAFGDAEKVVGPQWEILPADIPQKVRRRVADYRIGFCRVTGPKNRRTLLATLIPPGVVCGATVPTLHAEATDQWSYLPWLAQANSLVVDFILRQRLAANDVTNTLLDGLPMACVSPSDSLFAPLSSRVLSLVAAGPEMQAFMLRCSTSEWLAETAPCEDAGERRRIAAEIDVLVAREIFHLKMSDLETILATFPLLEKEGSSQDPGQSTRDLLWAAWDAV